VSNRAIIASVVLLAAAQLAGPLAAEDSFLGRSAEEWSAALASSQGPTQIHAAWAIAQLAGRSAGGPDDEAHLAQLKKLISNNDPTVRFWGVQGLATLGQRNGKDGEGAAILTTLEPLLADKSPAPRLAAAQTLGLLGQPAKALPVLVAAMSDPQESVRIQAVAALEELGEAARPAQATLEQATSDSSEYVKRISERALSALDPRRTPPQPKAKAGKAKSKAKSKQ
jgi:HEAT repeat protein